MFAQVNFWGSVNVTKQAIAFLRDVNKPAGGLLINMSSMFGIDAPPGAGFYAATYVSYLYFQTVTSFSLNYIQQVWWDSFFPSISCLFLNNHC